ncbi:hypothetical protein H6504_05210 [Candidatus Woesearchaeota archaeon]|nr:hypothetical protein [Candidatus Woesearchaeota archaeon]
MLVGVSESRKFLLEAFKEKPSLIIDCANSADPHRVFPQVMPEEMHDVYVMNAEAIYRYRDTLKQVPYWARRLAIKSIIVTSTRILFSYDDEEENHDVFVQCWELLKDISQRYKVIVEVGRKEAAFARKYCDAWG